MVLREGMQEMLLLFKRGGLEACIAKVRLSPN
jgi:hypothetical protein